MILRFAWNEAFSNSSPTCTSDIVNADGISPLCCLLTDDGGQAPADTLPWLDEGIGRIKSVKDSKIDFVDWSRDAWGVELSKSHAKVYSLYDSDCFEVIDLNSFEVALLGWRNFIDLTSQNKLVGEVDLEI